MSYRYTREPGKPELPRSPTASAPPTHAPTQKIDAALFPDTAAGKVLPTSENLEFLMVSYGIAAGHSTGPNGAMKIVVPGLNLDDDIPESKRLSASIEEIKSKAARCGLPLQGLDRRIAAYCVRHPLHWTYSPPVQPNQRIALVAGPL